MNDEYLQMIIHRAMITGALIAAHGVISKAKDELGEAAEEYLRASEKFRLFIVDELKMADEKFGGEAA